MDPTQTNKDIRRFLEHVDNVLEVAKGIYDLGESCTVYFGNLEESYEIPESDKEIIETEIKKRDVGTPELDWWKGYLDSVKINNPWG